MSAFFKPEDFGHLDTREDHARNVNAILSQNAIKGFAQKHRGEWSFTERPMKGDTHNALLLNLGAIEPCVHPIDKITLDAGGGDYLDAYYCECGQEMEIGSFVEKKK